MTTSISKPTQVLFATFITFFLLLLNEGNSLEELSFNFEKFSPNQMDLLFQGDASTTSSGVLQLTQVINGKPTSYSVGRARYLTPLRIWDRTTGKVASFNTSFSFVIKAPNAKITSDGLAFFLAPPDSQIPKGEICRYLGLFKNEKYDKSNQIVAVEFDTYFGKALDPWDPNFRHIGVDVNTIKSRKTVKWDWRNGQVASVTITYKAPTKALTVSLTYPSVQKRYSVTATVDLKAVLPELVRVGFSAATGAAGALETHDVLSWSFSSTFKTNNYDVTENNVHDARYTA